MKKPKCNTNCQFEMEKTEDNDICCYWCSHKSSCSNPCRNLDCKAVKEMEVDEG
jgi:hypothetical protein